MIRILIVCVALTLSACSTHYSETRQVDDQGFLQLSGEFIGKTLYIDGIAVPLDKAKTFSIDGAKVAKFAIDPGTHIIEVHDNGDVKVKRKIYITNGNVFEVIVP